MRIEGLQCGVVGAGLQQGEGFQKLAVWRHQGVDGGQQDVAAALHQIEIGEVERGAAARVGGPGIEIAVVRRVGVYQASEGTDDQGVAVAIGLQVGADSGRRCR
jgi:hypothetical protein